MLKSLQKSVIVRYASDSILREKIDKTSVMLNLSGAGDSQ